jgi:hypothetical protein
VNSIDSTLDIHSQDAVNILITDVFSHFINPVFYTKIRGLSTSACSPRRSRKAVVRAGMELGGCQLLNFVFQMRHAGLYEEREELFHDVSGK